MANVVFKLDKCNKSVDDCPICLNGIQIQTIVSFHETTAQKVNHYVCYSCFDQLIVSCRQDEILPRCPMERSVISDLRINPNLLPNEHYQELRAIIQDLNNSIEIEDDEIEIEDDMEESDIEEDVSDIEEESDEEDIESVDERNDIDNSDDEFSEQDLIQELIMGVLAVSRTMMEAERYYHSQQIQN